MKAIRNTLVMLILILALSYAQPPMRTQTNANCWCAMEWYLQSDGRLDSTATAGLGVAWAVQSAVQGFLWGAVYGGAVGAWVGLGWSL